MKKKKTHTVILLHLLYYLPLDKVQIDNGIHKEANAFAIATSASSTW